MADLLTRVYNDCLPFFTKREIDLVSALKITDILICRLDIDTNEVSSLLDCFISLNRLLKGFYKSEGKIEEALFDNNRIELMKKDSSKLSKFIEYRLQFYSKYEPELLEVIDSFTKPT